MKTHKYIALTSLVATAALAGTGWAATAGDIGDQAAPLARGHAFVLGLGQQQPGTDALFSIRAVSVPTSTGTQLASGDMTWEETNPATLVAARVTCVQVNGNDAIVTGILTIPASRAGQHVVAEAIDDDSTGAGDALRFSYQSNGGAVKTSVPNCWAPTNGPVPIATGFLETLPPAPGT